MLPILIAPFLVTALTQQPEKNATDPIRRQLQPGEVEIEYIAHACFRIRSPGGKKLLIDPYASQVWLGYDFPPGIEADAALITHPHYDHDAGRSLELDISWMDGFAIHDRPGRYELGDVRITGIAGKHADPWGKEFGQTNTIWLVEVADLRIVHLGDNGALSAENLADLGRVDVLLAPIDSKEHILHRDGLAAIRAALNPPVIVPMHYRIPDLERDEESPKDLGTIDPFLESEAHVRRLDSHLAVFASGTLPRIAEVVVFRHSPAVVRPSGAR